MQHGLLVPPVGDFADPNALIELSVRAEHAGWDGVFLWDHVLRRAEEPPEVADPWIALAAIAVATGRVRIGTLVTPLTRRRPIKVARETITLDHLSGGRLTLGLGLGVDSSRELSAFGEIAEQTLMAQRLDEGVELLCRFWSGEQVDFRGEQFVADAVTVLPRPRQRPRIPLWFAARTQARRPLRRAARFDGLVPIEVDERGLAQMLDVVREERGGLDGFDVAARPQGAAQYESFAELGMTWAIYQPEVGDPELGNIAATDPALHFARR